MEGIPDNVFNLAQSVWKMASKDMLEHGKLSVGGTLMVDAKGRTHLIPHGWSNEVEKQVGFKVIRILAQKISPLAVMHLDECFVVVKDVKDLTPDEKAGIGGDYSKRPDAKTQLMLTLELRNGRTFMCNAEAIMTDGKTTGFVDDKFELEETQGASGNMMGMCKVF